MLSRACLITAHAPSKRVGIRNSRAKTLIVPSGSTPKRTRLKPSGSSPIPLRTSLTVPSPPAATTISQPSRTASAARGLPPPAANVGFRMHSFDSASRWSRNFAAFSPRAAGLKMTHVFIGQSFRQRELQDATRQRAELALVVGLPRILQNVHLPICAQHQIERPSQRREDR